MKVKLLWHSPLWVCAKAIRTCWASEDKSDTCYHKDSIIDLGDRCQCIKCEEEFSYMEGIKIITGEKDKDLICRVGNKFKHASTLEHLVYSFDIDGISRACLQELARHRMASLSVKSTRYTLRELRDSKDFLASDFCVSHNLPAAGQQALMNVLLEIKTLLKQGYGNDYVKHLLPEAYKTSLVWTINARSLQNFLSLRTSKSALWEIRELAYAIYDELPNTHKYLFEEFVNDSKQM